MLYSIFSHLNAIVFSLRVLFICLIIVRFYRPQWLRRISFGKLAFAVLAFELFYGLFVAGGQYYVWTITDPTGTYTKLPYFLHYAWTNFWLAIIINVVLSGIVYGLFKLWSSYRGGFLEYGPELIMGLMFAVGFPGILALIPMGFILSVVAYLLKYGEGEIVLSIEPFFIWAAFPALIFARAIFLHVL